MGTHIRCANCGRYESDPWAAHYRLEGGTRIALCAECQTAIGDQARQRHMSVSHLVRDRFGKARRR